MDQIKSEHFSVAIIPPATPYRPVDTRKYTLVPSQTGYGGHLAIGNQYGELSSSEEEPYIIKAEWKAILGVYELHLKVCASEETSDIKAAKSRINDIEVQMEPFLTFIVNADRALFEQMPWLLDVPIYLCESTPRYLGTPRRYIGK